VFQWISFLGTVGKFLALGFRFFSMGELFFSGFLFYVLVLIVDLNYSLKKQ